MVSFIKLNCSWCDSIFERTIKRHNQAKRRKYNNAFCSIACLKRHQSKTFTKRPNAVAKSCLKCHKLHRNISKLCSVCRRSWRVCVSCNELMTKKNYKDSYCIPCRTRYQTKVWCEKKIKAVQYLGGVCKRCGLNGIKKYYLIDFDHRDPSQKDVSWHKLRKRSWKKIKKELDKCDPLCSNCHRHRHHRLYLERRKSGVPARF